MNKIPIINLKNYKIKDEIGSGAYGKVYLVENTHTSTEYAAKVSLNNDDKSIDKNDLQSEIFAYSKVDNQAILRIIGYSSIDFNGKNNPTIILDYMKNGSLDKYFLKPKNAQLNQKNILYYLEYHLG